VIAVLAVAATRTARARLEGLLAGARAVRAVAAVPGLSLAQQVEDARPDVLLVDLDAAGLGQLLGDLARVPAAPAVVALGDAEGIALATLLRRGVRGYLPREAARPDVVAAIEAAAAGLVALAPDAIGALGDRQAPARLRAADGAREVTPRELEILGLLADGLHNRAIAARLGISTHTVKFHLGSLFAKLEVGTRAEAVTAGIRRGLIPI
jgi:DNA-binding NarL/FixJ family response regulator